MKQIVQKSAVLLAALCVLAVFVPATASAERPEIEQNEFANDFVFADECGEGIDLRLVANISQTVTTFFDSDGNELRSLVQNDVDVTFTRSDSDATFVVSGRYSGDLDPFPGERVFRGVLSKSTVPGAGLIFSDIGRQFYDADNNLIFGAGQDEEDSAFAAACDILA